MMLKTNSTMHRPKGQNAAAGVDHLSQEAREAAIQLGQMLDKYRAAIEYDLMKYKLTSDALGIAHWDMDVTGGDPCSPDNTFTWSPEFRRMLGYSADGDFSGTFSNLTDRIHPEDKAHVLHNFSASMADRTGKAPFDAEFRIRSASGEYLYIRAYGAALRARDGTPVRIAGATENITAQKAARDSLRETEGRLQIMLDASTLPITMWDRSGRIIDCSQTAVETFGFASKQELMEGLMRFAPEYQPCGRRSADLFTEEMAKTFATGFTRLEWTHMTTGGEPLLFDVTAKRVKYKGDYALMFYPRDIREEKETQEKLANRERTLDLLNKAALALLSREEKTFADAMNKGLGLTANTAGIEILSIFRNSDGPDGLCMSQIYRWRKDAGGIVEPRPGLKNLPYSALPSRYVSALSSGEYIVGSRDPIPDGGFPAKFGCANTLAVPVFDGGKFWGFTFFERSTEEIYTEQEIEVLRSASFMLSNAVIRNEEADAVRGANEAKNIFLAQMSHEMRTPLSAVIGLSELVLEKGGLSDDNEVYLDKIYNAGSTLLTIVNDILDISKIEAGKFEILSQEYDVPSLINDAITQNILRIHSKPVQFTLNIDPNVPARLCGDDIRVKQILSNLLSNAFKYTDKGTVELSIGHERDGDSVWTIFRVSDTGIGIRPDDLKRLFTDYTRFDGESNRKIGGTGLGLSITKRMVELMDGTVTVKSEYGKGSTFTTRIRQKYVNGALIGAEMAEHLRSFSYTTSKRRSGAQLERVKLPYARVLVVDDNVTNLDIAQALLQPYGMKIDCVTGGQAAIDAIRSEKVKYSAVFMDHMMPEMDGVEAVQIIREEIGSEYARTLPIIALTANAVAGNKEWFISCGFNAFVSKPIDIFRLDSVIRKWIWDKEREGQPDQPRKFVEKRENSDRRRGGDRRVSSRRQSVPQTAAGNQNISGIDWAKGESLFGGEESYRRVLRSFAVNTRPLLGKITEVSGESLAEYAIIVHGIKSSGRGVCAYELGTMAESLEFAAKDGNLQFVSRNNPDFLIRARMLIEDIEVLLDEKRGESAKPSKDKPEAALLRRLHDACSSFDMNAIESVMREIEGYTYTGDGGLVEWIRENIAKLNYAQVAEKIMEAV